MSVVTDEWITVCTLNSTGYVRGAGTVANMSSKLAQGARAVQGEFMALGSIGQNASSVITSGMSGAVNALLTVKTATDSATAAMGRMQMAAGLAVAAIAAIKHAYDEVTDALERELNMQKDLQDAQGGPLDAQAYARAKKAAGDKRDFKEIVKEWWTSDKTRGMRDRFTSGNEAGESRHLKALQRSQRESRARKNVEEAGATGMLIPGLSVAAAAMKRMEKYSDRTARNTDTLVRQNQRQLDIRSMVLGGGNLADNGIEEVDIAAMKRGARRGAAKGVRRIENAVEAAVVESLERNARRR